MATEYDAPIPSVRASESAAKTCYPTFFIKSDSIHLVEKENVETRATCTAAELSQDVADGFVQKFYVAVDSLWQSYRDRASGAFKSNARRQRLRIECDRITGKCELLFLADVKDIAASG